LLEANDIKANSPNLVPLAGLTAAEALQQSQIDAAFIVAAQEAPVVQVMLRSPGLRVVSFSQADAYLRSVSVRPTPTCAVSPSCRRSYCRAVSSIWYATCRHAIPFSWQRPPTSSCATTCTRLWPHCCCRR